MKKILFLLFVAFVVIGCGGGGEGDRSRYAGRWEGSWVNIDNPVDSGESDWIIRENGVIEGLDYDDDGVTVYDIFGNIDGDGRVRASLGSDVTDTYPLEGRLDFEGQNQLRGTLRLERPDPITYRYILRRY